LRAAIDTGGTFTDCVYVEGGELRVLKVFSTPADPSAAVLEALGQIGDGPLEVRHKTEVRHGTTVGTNAMLEGRTARIAFITTAGFEDTIAIGRQTRSRLYDWFAPAPRCLVPRELRFGLPERVSAEGVILQSPTEAELEILVEKVRASGAEAVAISLLFSFANPITEKRVESALQRLGIPVSTSHRILPEFREYERASTTVVNAALSPLMQRYLLRLEENIGLQHGGRVQVMQSSGGIIPAHLASREPVRTILSGPAGGVMGAWQVAQWARLDKVIGIDMGGTSTDVFLADATSGGVQQTGESVVAGVPIGVPMLDIHTAGAGGGSIARFDAGGMLRVGPESAGADPGPICFGRGTQPTVTDANFLLGRLDEATFLGGGVHLDRRRTEAFLNDQKGSLESAAQFADGILRVIDAEMERAIRVISVERGHDPREFTLVAFGGGGPLHACSLARTLRIAHVLVPAMPGALSAVGILLADTVRDFSRTVMLPGDVVESCGEMCVELERSGTAEFTEEGLEGMAHHSMDVRYRGQGYELNVPYHPHSPTSGVEAFHRAHQQRYGFSDVERPVEIVNLRLRMVAAGERYVPARRKPVRGDGRAACYAERDVFFDGRFIKSRFYRRDGLVPGDVVLGPAMITEYTSATALPPGCRAEVDGTGNLVIDITEAYT
jgi:N-methylhydantoinase A